MSFLSKDCYKKIYILKFLKFRHLFKNKFYKNSSNIPNIFSTTQFKLYNGKRWRRKIFVKYSVGHKFGEFTWNRKIAFFKRKQKKKKKKIRFEQLLNVYWKKRVYISTETIEFYEKLDSLKLIFGINNYLIKTFYSIFNWHKKFNITSNSFDDIPWEQTRSINILLSKYFNINLKNIERYIFIIIKLYLIKSYRGICHYLSKPVKSQRTHSNRKSKSYLSTIAKRSIKTLIEKNAKTEENQKNYYINVQKKDKRKKKKKASLNKLEEFVVLKSWF